MELKVYAPLFLLAFSYTISADIYFMPGSGAAPGCPPAALLRGWPWQCLDTL